MSRKIFENETSQISVCGANIHFGRVPIPCFNIDGVDEVKIPKSQSLRDF
jgi:hypothetical protein